MSVYDVKIKRLALLLLPTFLRKPLMAAFAQSMVQGVNVVHGDFARWRDGRNYRLAHNGQVCHLRAVLNDTFDQVERRIRVEDEESGAMQGSRVFVREAGRQVLLFRREENNPFVINRRGFGGASGLDFWVTVPRLLRGTIDETRLSAVADMYKLAGKRWTINYD